MIAKTECSGGPTSGVSRSVRIVAPVVLKPDCDSNIASMKVMCRLPSVHVSLR